MEVEVIDFATRLYKKAVGKKLHLLLDTRADLVSMADGRTVETAMFETREQAERGVALGQAADARAIDAQNVANAAKTDASVAQVVANIAKDSAREAIARADAGVVKAESAQSVADKAQAAASGAQSTADKAQAAADNAQLTASRGVSDAAAAQSTANSANIEAGKANTTASANAQTIQQLTTKLATLEAEIKNRGIYNTEEFITASGTYTVKVTGWYEVTIIDGGGGAYIFDAGGYTGRPGRASQSLVFLRQGATMSVTIGAGGAGCCKPTSAWNEADGLTVANGGRTSFGSLTSGSGRGWQEYEVAIIDHMRSENRDLQANSPLPYDAGYGRGGNARFAMFGGVLNDAGTYANAGVQGCVILRYYNPAKADG